MAMAADEPMLVKFTGDDKEEIIKEHVKLLRDDLAFLFDERDIDANVQAAISALGYRTINRFAFLGRALADVEEFCRDDVGIPRSREGRAMVSRSPTPGRPPRSARGSGTTRRRRRQPARSPAAAWRGTM